MDKAMAGAEDISGRGGLGGGGDGRGSGVVVLGGG